MSKQPEPESYVLINWDMLDLGIMSKPPLYLKLLMWIILNARHNPYKDGRPCELYRSTLEIREAMVWYIGCIKKMPTTKQIWSALHWLDKGNMIAVTKDKKFKGGLDIVVLESGLCIIPDNCEV